MKEPDPKTVAVRFNDCINKQDVDGLAKLTTEHHVFIDSDNVVHRGKALMVKSWSNFFEKFPDYRNHFSTVESRNNLVLITGHSTCSFKALDGPALWTAKTENGLVAEWRVYLDNTTNRKKLSLPT